VAVATVAEVRSARIDNAGSQGPRSKRERGRKGGCARTPRQTPAGSHGLSGGGVLTALVNPHRGGHVYRGQKSYFEWFSHIFEIVMRGRAHQNVKALKNLILVFFEICFLSHDLLIYMIQNDKH
jgi:hypothetical protein